MAEPQTDLDYNFDSSVTTPAEPGKDVDQGNVSILVKHLKDIDGWIAKHNTLDVLDDTSKLTAEQQKVAHRQLVTYLRQFRGELVEKIKELK